MALALVALAILSPVGGYHLAGFLSAGMEFFGWRLSQMDPGFSLGVVLLMAAAFLFAGNVGIVLTLVMRRAAASGKMASE